MIDTLKKLSAVHVWMLSIVSSVVVTECIVAFTGVMLKWDITHDYLIKGLIASLFVTVFVGGFLMLFLTRQRAADFRIDPVVETREGTLLTDPAIGGDAGTTDHYSATQRDIPACELAEEAVRDSRGQSKLKLAIKNLDVLPAMPIIAQRLLALNLDTEEGKRALMVLIEQDPLISAKILGLANSAMVGASRNITTVREAALLLGTKRVQSVAASIAIISLMAKPPAGEFNTRDLWLHSFRIAFAMQSIARLMPTNMRPPDDQIFLAGMLHDIGYLVLAYLDPKLSDKLHTRLATEPDRPAMEVEREILEICHDEIGAELGVHWSLPDEIVMVLRYHHCPDSPGAATGHPLVRMLNIAEKLLPSFGIWEYVTPDISAEEWEALGLASFQAAEVKEQVDEQAEQAIQFASSFT